MATAYLASTDFPRNRSVMERPITISLPPSLSNNTTPPPAPSTDSFHNSVTRIVEAIRPSSTDSTEPSTESPATPSTTPRATNPLTASGSTTPEPTRSDNNVLSLIRGSMSTIERVASSLLPRPTASTEPITTVPTVPTTSSSDTTPSRPAPSLSTTPPSSSSPRGLSVAEPAPAALRASPVFAARDSSAVSLLNPIDQAPLTPLEPSRPRVASRTLEEATLPVTQTLIDRYPTTSTDTLLAPDLLMLEEPLIADVYYPADLATPVPDLATIMEQDPLILWA
ncbi:MAG: hypothetical protein WAQ53_03385 [Thiofilum sp.]|uniref:hypothetical protein n=1 Tax=Thiofilum sp. TaxID=2212733 RepID=UPI0025CB9E20|nr:hypothetical protein [Thiofilum sp.]MBK8454734.1 hypothetical protein [Thiofilum sp.]